MVDCWNAMFLSCHWASATLGVVFLSIVVFVLRAKCCEIFGRMGKGRWHWCGLQGALPMTTTIFYFFPILSRLKQLLRKHKRKAYCPKQLRPLGVLVLAVKVRFSGAGDCQSRVLALSQLAGKLQNPLLLGSMCAAPAMAALAPFQRLFLGRSFAWRP